MKEISEGAIVKEIPTQNATSAEMVLSQLAISISGKFLFSGTASGSIRSFKVPLDNEWTSLGAHSANITGLAVSIDDQYLFSASEDGLLIMFSINGLFSEFFYFCI